MHIKLWVDFSFASCRFGYTRNPCITRS
jgi:hypothetical protein